MTEPKAPYLRLSPERRDEIEKTVMRLYIENPYDKVTAKLLCDALKINPATLYRWFDSKDDFYLYLQTKLTNKMMPPVIVDWSMDDFATDDPLKDGTLTGEEGAFAGTWVRTSDEVMRRIAFEDIFDCERLIRYNLERMKKTGEVRPDTDTELATFIIKTVSYNIQRYLVEHNVTDVNEAERIKRYVYYNLLRLGTKGREPQKDDLSGE